MELKEFFASWEDNKRQTKQFLLDVLQIVTEHPDMTTEFKARPGISYSVRVGTPKQQDGRPLFAIFDVIDDDPDDRWLSLCFYADLIFDDEERGDLVPRGLLDEDAICFDVDSFDRDYVEYVKERLNQAFTNCT